MKYRLLIVDSETAYASFLADRLSKHTRLDVIDIANDGMQALSLIRAKKPDIVLMEMLLPGLDGICLLKEMQKIKRPPTAVCCSSFYSAVSVEAARRNGASYYAYKPMDSDALATILIDCAEMADEFHRLNLAKRCVSDNDDRSRCIHEILNGLGFSPKLTGSQYLVESIMLACESPMLLHNLSAGLYSRLAERMSVSAAAIERNIRSAIDAANRTGRLTHQIGSSPTNKVCIQYILRILNQQE